MLPELSDDVLIFIITLVATSSLKDLLNLSKTCKVLKKHCLNAEVAHCCALDISLTRNMYKVDGNRDSFYQLLESSRNPEYCFRMGILDICYQISNYDSARNFLEMALQQGHDGAKYTLAILNIFSGNVENHGKGRTSLTELWFQKKLYKCRHMIREAINSDGYWVLRRSWPNNLVYSKVCVDQFEACKEPQLKKGLWWANSDEDYEFDTCINCRLDLEVDWFLKEVKYDPPQQP